MAEKWIEVTVGDKESDEYKKMKKIIEQGVPSEIMDPSGIWINVARQAPVCGRLYAYKDPYYELKKAK